MLSCDHCTVIEPDTFRRCNVAKAGSKPGKMQRTAKERRNKK